MKIVFCVIVYLIPSFLYSMETMETPKPSRVTISRLSKDKMPKIIGLKVPASTDSQPESKESKRSSPTFKRVQKQSEPLNHNVTRSRRLSRTEDDNK